MSQISSNGIRYSLFFRKTLRYTTIYFSRTLKPGMMIGKPLMHQWASRNVIKTVGYRVTDSSSLFVTNTLPNPAVFRSIMRRQPMPMDETSIPGLLFRDVHKSAGHLNERYCSPFVTETLRNLTSFHISRNLQPRMMMDKSSMLRSWFRDDGKAPRHKRGWTPRTFAHRMLATSVLHSNTGWFYCSVGLQCLHAFYCSWSKMDMICIQ